MNKSSLVFGFLVGLKIRVQNDPVAIDTVRALGASPTPIAWGRLSSGAGVGKSDIVRVSRATLPFYFILVLALALR
jgi:hypothetical protein